MDRRLLNHLLECCRPGSELVRVYSHTIIPDESLIPTVLSWTEAPRHGAALTYVEWLSELDEPRSLTVEDLQTVLDSDAPFCRKVRSPDSDSLLDALDARLEL